MHTMQDTMSPFTPDSMNESLAAHGMPWCTMIQPPTPVTLMSEGVHALPSTS